MSFRILFDSTTPVASIPLDAEMVGTYCSGDGFIPLHDVVERWPNAKQVRINVDGNPALGDCLDVENGDATPADVDPWAHARLKAGVPMENLAVYCNRSTLPAVQAATSLKLFHWVATLDGTLIIPGYGPLVAPAAVQFIDLQPQGVNVDVSLVIEDGWHPHT